MKKTNLTSISTERLLYFKRVSKKNIKNSSITKKLTWSNENINKGNENINEGNEMINME